MRYRFLYVVATLALVAGCGGSGVDGDEGQGTVAESDSGSVTDDQGDVATDDGSTTQNDDQGDSETDDGDDTGSGDSGSGTNTAVVTIADQTYEFEWESDGFQRCNPDFFGGFAANAGITSDAPSFEAEFPPPDHPERITPKVEVSDPENDTSWTADPEETIGTTVDNWPAQVNSHQIDGTTVSGTATFVGSNMTSGESPEGVEGSFEITCAPRG